MGRDKHTDKVVLEYDRDHTVYTTYVDNIKAEVRHSMFDGTFIAYCEIAVKAHTVIKSYYLGNYPDLDSATKKCVEFLESGGILDKNE